MVAALSWLALFWSYWRMSWSHYLTTVLISICSRDIWRKQRQSIIEGTNGLIWVGTSPLLEMHIYGIKFIKYWLDQPKNEGFICFEILSVYAKNSLNVNLLFTKATSEFCLHLPFIFVHHIPPSFFSTLRGKLTRWYFLLYVSVLGARCYL